MSDSLPPVWDADEHTLAKHIILKGYLDAWMAIMTSQGAKVGSLKPALFVDGFAGPGVYSGDQEGSPIRAVRAALEHSRQFPVPVEFLFIEANPKRYLRLLRELAKLETQIQASPNVRLRRPIQADCVSTLARLIDEHDRQRRPFGPALIFLDQFGYSSVPLDFIAKVMAHDLCEVLTYLNYDHLNRFLSDPSKDEARTKAFGTDEWKQAIYLEGNRREDFLRSLYLNALREKAGSDYVWSFAMANEKDVLIYWLFFCTKNIRGLELMKRAMWAVDERGGFRFSDRVGLSQLTLLSQFNEDWLMGHLAHRFHGQTLEAHQVQKYVLTDTPCYRCWNALRRMRKDGRIELPDHPRRQVSFEDHPETRIRFCSTTSLTGEQGSLFSSG